MAYLRVAIIAHLLRDKLKPEIRVIFPVIRGSQIAGAVGVKGWDWVSLDLTKLKEGPISVAMQFSGLGIRADVWTNDARFPEVRGLWLLGLVFEKGLLPGNDDTLTVAAAQGAGVEVSWNLSRLLPDAFDYAINYSFAELLEEVIRRESQNKSPKAEKSSAEDSGQCRGSEKDECGEKAEPLVFFDPSVQPR